MLSRNILGLAAVCIFGTTVIATAPSYADWRDEYKEIRFARQAAESDADTRARFGPFMDYLTRKLGVPVRHHRTTDYASVVEALRAKQAEIARSGPAAYALAHKVMGDGVAPIALEVGVYGNRGYHSVILVKADSPYQSLADLKGKTLAWADPNSGSGYVAPNFFLTKEGMDPEQFFGKTVFAGGHENAVIGLLNGQYDAAANWWHNDVRSNYKQMASKGMISEDDIRIIWTSERIPNTPYMVRTDLPKELIDLIVQALQDLPQEDPVAWKAYSDDKIKEISPTSHEEYLEVIEMVEFNQKHRRQRQTN